MKTRHRPVLVRSGWLFWRRYKVYLVLQVQGEDGAWRDAYPVDLVKIRESRLIGG